MQFDQLKRREFITLLGGAAVAWPLRERAQQASSVARIGFLGSTFASSWASRVEAFRSGLLQLKKHSIHKLIVVGLIAHTCIEASVRYAAERVEDYQIARCIRFRA